MSILEFRCSQERLPKDLGSNYMLMIMLGEEINLKELPEYRETCLVIEKITAPIMRNVHRNEVYIRCYEDTQWKIVVLKKDIEKSWYQEATVTRSRKVFVSIISGAQTEINNNFVEMLEWMKANRSNGVIR